MHHYTEAEKIFKQCLQSKGVVLDSSLVYKNTSIHFLHYRGNSKNPDYSKINIVIKNQKGEVKKRMIRFDLREGDYNKLKKKILDVEMGKDEDIFSKSRKTSESKPF